MDFTLQSDFCSISTEFGGFPEDFGAMGVFGILLYCI